MREKFPHTAFHNQMKMIPIIIDYLQRCKKWEVHVRLLVLPGTSGMRDKLPAEQS